MTTDLLFPFRDKRVLGTTTDSDHFAKIDLASEVMIPLPNHPGAFGVTRKFHVHEGVDLYCIQQEPVYGMEAGLVVGVLPFTGPLAGSPWWHDTFAVLIEGDHGVINYGELIPASGIAPGVKVARGDLIGNITTVLKKDKGRPQTMLHLELYDPGSSDVVEWKVGLPIPKTLRDPTPLLISSSHI